jgi:hypothetical protein
MKPYKNGRELAIYDGSLDDARKALHDVTVGKRNSISRKISDTFCRVQEVNAPMIGGCYLTLCDADVKPIDKPVFLNINKLESVRESYSGRHRNGSKINDNNNFRHIVKEDYDLNSDFEDGGSIYDRDTFGKNEDELENYYRSQKLDDKRYQNQEYEALRNRKMDRGDYVFRQNMEDKLKKIFPKYDPEKLYQSYTTSINNALDSIRDMRSDIAIMVSHYKDAYNKTGDERFLMAANSEMRSLRYIIEDKINRLNRNPHVKINLSIDFMDEKLKNYSPLSKDKVYDYDSETKTYSSRSANISDRKKGYNG